MELEHVIQLPEGSDNTPTFKSLHPQYEALIYGDDSIRLTAKERKLLHLYEDDSDVTLLPDPKPAEDVVPLASCLDVPLGDTPNATSSTSTLATPSALTVVPLSSHIDALPGDNPYSASLTSTSITDSISSSASASRRNPSGSDSFGPVRPARSNARSRDYRGLFRQPKARNRGCSVYERPFESGRNYAPPSSAGSRAPYYHSERPSEPGTLRYGSASLPVAPSPSLFQGREVARPIESHLVSAQEEQHMVQDADTRNLVMVPIVCTSFSQLGITGPQRNEYAPAGPSASDHYWQDTMPGHHPYHQPADPWNHDGRHPSAFHDSMHRRSQSNCPRERWDRHESHGQPLVSRSQGHQDDNATAQDTMGPTRGWGSGPAVGWGASEPW